MQIVPANPELVTPESRRILNNLITSIPDSLFYELVANRLNIPLQKRATTIVLGSEQEVREYYSLEYLVDVIFLEIAAVRDIVVMADGKRVTIRRYYNQALRLWPSICVGKPVPEYIVNISDLTPRTVVELKALDKFSSNYAITQAVGRVFENIHAKAYQLNIARRLKARLDQ